MMTLCRRFPVPKCLFISSTRTASSSSSSSGSFSYAVNKQDLLKAQNTLPTKDPTASLGVFSQSESDDLDILINNFTAPALARALREREATLHTAAYLAQTKSYEELTRILQPFLRTSVENRRIEKTDWDISRGFTKRELSKIQRQLHRMPREVFQAATKRASVLIPLCNSKVNKTFVLFPFTHFSSGFFLLFFHFSNDALFPHFSNFLLFSSGFPV